MAFCNLSSWLFRIVKPHALRIFCKNRFFLSCAPEIKNLAFKSEGSVICHVSFPFFCVSGTCTTGVSIISKCCNFALLFVFSCGQTFDGQNLQLWNLESQPLVQHSQGEKGPVRNLLLLLKSALKVGRDPGKLWGVLEIFYQKFAYILS